MKAIWYNKYGSAEDVLKFGDVPNPEPQPGEVLIRVVQSGVNPSDVKRRSGRSATRQDFPMIIPHNDGAGIIERVGEGVPPSRIGEHVWIYEAQIRRPFGTAAEYVAVPSELVVQLPNDTSFEMGATLGVPAMTAHRCVFSNGMVRDKTILVTGGAGAVGNYAIQFAKWGGAKVITTVSSKEKADVAGGAGADHIINYKNEDVVKRVREITNGEGVDRIIEVDLGTNLLTDSKILKYGGVVASYASDGSPEAPFPFYSLFSRNPIFELVLVYTMSKEAHRAAAADITRCLEEKVLRPTFGKTFSLEETIEAHKAVESGKVIGKVLVKIT